MSQIDSTERPSVLIVGAGIGGLMTAILLEQINVPYHVFERADTVKQLGSAMSFGGTTLCVLEQLGLYEELLQVSMPYTDVLFCTGNCESLGKMDFVGGKDITGYRHLAFSRPEFYNILRRRIPDDKISFKKKVLKVEEDELQVTITCSDNTSYSGDILIGADGAYSGVRQSMYKKMEEKGILPKSDLEGFNIGYTVTVGVTGPCDPEKYPILKNDLGHFEQILYNDNNNCYIISLPDNKISWGFGTQLPQSMLKEMHFRNSEWSSENSAASLKDYRDFPCPVGGTMGEIFDATPKELISKVYLEEKIFKTWYHDRTVLIGDACHKLHPAAGLGASNAIFDAVILANCLYAMKDSSAKSIKAAFDEYYSERFSHAKVAFQSSSGMAKLLNGQKFSERLLRKVVLNYVPPWVFLSSRAKNWRYRPQVAWLPLVKNRGTGEVFPQHFEKRR